MPRDPAVPCTAAVEVRDGQPVLLINGEPRLPVLYALTDVPPGCWTSDELARRNLSLFAEIGFDLFQVDLFLEHVWPSPGELDAAPALGQIRGVLDVRPDAAVFVRLHVNPPPWWIEEHPDELVQFADAPVEPDHPSRQRLLDGDLEPRPRVSLASGLWLRDCGEMTRRLLEAVAAAPEGDALAGVQPACGVFGEWHYWAFLEHEPDIGPAMTARFRRWLAEKYGTDRALRAAWRSPSASLEDAAVPGLEERRGARAGYFRDPARERPVMDYYRCQHETTADALIAFCRIARESWPRPLVTGTFYGYYFGVFRRQAAGGHLALDRVLRSPHVDYLSAPPSYESHARDVGGSGQSRGLVESCALHGKLWLDEMDQTPNLNNEAERWGSPKLRDAVSVLRRNVAQALTRRAGLWFYDFGASRGRGWWDHPVLLGEIRRLKRLFDARDAAPEPPPGDVLLVYDTECYYALAAGADEDPVSPLLLEELSVAAYRSGAAIETVHLASLERVDWPRYRAVVFANTFVLDAGQRAFIHEHVARDGRHLLWLCAPGYSDGLALSAGFVCEATGVALEPVELAEPPVEVIECSGFPSARLEVKAPVRPLFVVADPAAACLGVLDGSDRVAFARKDLPGSTAWFSSLPLVSPDVLRSIFWIAGAHIYSDGSDVVHCGRGVLCVHTLNGGDREIQLRSGRVVSVDLPAHSTMLFDAQTGEVLMQ